MKEKLPPRRLRIAHAENTTGNLFVSWDEIENWAPAVSIRVVRQNVSIPVVEFLDLLVKWKKDQGLA